MTSKRLLLPLLAVALAACTQPREPARPAAATTPSAPAPAAAPAKPATPMPNTGADAPGDALPARFDGYGPLYFGMTEAQALEAWGGKLEGVTPAGLEGACHYLYPASSHPPAYLAFMFEGGRFVRYDIGNDEAVAPGGGRRGMDEARIEALYPGRITRSPHKYVDGGEYLRIHDAQGEGELVFETDAGGRVTEWRAGIAPQVGYIEGCA